MYKRHFPRHIEPLPHVSDFLLSKAIFVFGCFLLDATRIERLSKSKLVYRLHSAAWVLIERIPEAVAHFPTCQREQLTFAISRIALTTSRTPIRSNLRMHDRRQRWIHNVL